MNYYGSGCYDCGGWSAAGAAVAGATVGLAAGAAVGEAESATANANAANAYTAGYAAGAGASATYPIGAIYATVPASCSPTTLAGVTYYLCGNSWLQPSYGANGVFYRVVPAP
ncbi:MAG: hypothetical protein U0802_11535 [Candidatus Binatia bacterium]